ITELSGSFLADYEVQRIFVELSESEKLEYETARADYLSFLKEKQISMGGGGWKRFIQEAARSKRGREAFRSYHVSKKIAHGSESKIQVLGELLAKERGRRCIVFTNDNATAYRISKRFLLPCITHQSDVKERQQIISHFASGTYRAITTSRVLNEGVDIPAAEVGIVLSGTGTVREHVQRLGRILRPKEGKKAIMYELVSADTAEQYTSERRRKHDAYR
ncbi:MAG: helicase-related protein, partial [Myxococcota bacterium]|nr:helicase-related protein [Myxococcota bacterium]